MKAHNKIILDRMIAKPAAYILNAVVRAVGSILRHSHADDPACVRVIAVAKLLGMGSILRSTPLLAALKKKYPHATYLYITARKNKALLEHLPGIDRALYIRDTSIIALFVDTVRVIAQLWRYKVDLYFDLEVYSAFAAMLPALGLARNRYGFYLGSTLFKRGLHTHLVYFNAVKNISRIYLALGKECGITVSGNGNIQRLRVDDADAAELEAWSIAGNIPLCQPYIVVNPNASDLLLERRWPREYFAVLLNHLVRDWTGEVFAVGSSDEKAYAASLLALLSPQARRHVHNTAGELSLGAVMALIERSEAMITNDSGLYHIGSSFNTKMISLWGPVDPAHYMQAADDRETAFYARDVYCTPCLHRTDSPPCAGNNICMKSIHPLLVYKKLCELLRIKASEDAGAFEAAYAGAIRTGVDRMS